MGGTYGWYIWAVYMGGTFEAVPLLLLEAAAAHRAVTAHALAALVRVILRRQAADVRVL